MFSLPTRRTTLIAALGSVSLVSVLTASWLVLGALINKAYDGLCLDDIDYDQDDLELELAA
jgi:hypothetical protein